MGGWGVNSMVVVGSIVLGMMPHTSNCLFLIYSSANKSFPFHHVLVPLVEEDSVSIMYDESNGSGSDSDAERMILLSLRNNN